MAGSEGAGTTARVMSSAAGYLLCVRVCRLLRLATPVFVRFDLACEVIFFFFPHRQGV